MLKYFVVISALLGLGQMMEIQGNKYNYIQAGELDSVQKILSEATAEAASNTAINPDEIIKTPSAGTNRRSHGDSQNLQDLQVLSHQMTYTHAFPKYESKAKCKQALNDETKYDQNYDKAKSRTLDRNFDDTKQITNDYKTGVTKRDCKSSRITKDSDVNKEIQNNIKNKLIEEQNTNDDTHQIMDFRSGPEAVAHNANEKDSIDHGNKELCSTTNSYKYENSRRSMGDDTDSNILPSGSGEPNQDISKYQHNLNLRSELIRNQLLEKKYDEGQVSSYNKDMNDFTSYNKDMNDFIYSDNYHTIQYVTSPNIERSERLPNKNVGVVKSHDLIEVSEKVSRKDKQQILDIEQKVANPGKLSRTIGNTKDKTTGNSVLKIDSKDSMNYMEVEDQMQPTKGAGLLDKSYRRVNLIENPRVCYACSSTNNVNCWRPNRQTTVKYCRKEHDACVTKTYNTKEKGFVVIRDCSSTCDITMPLLETKYASCSICKSDLCNQLYVGNDATDSFNGRSVVVMIIIAGFSNIFL